MRGCEMIAGYRCAIYDNGGKTIDRYTVCLVDCPENIGCVEALFLSELDGTLTDYLGVSMFDSAKMGKHLGRRIAFKCLSPYLQKHIVSRLS